MTKVQKTQKPSKSRATSGKRRGSRKKSATGNYRVKNWSQYNTALRQRGSITVWLSEEMIAEWHQKPEITKRGGQQQFSDTAILLCLTMKYLYGLAYRQTEGFLASLVQIMHLTVMVPHYSTVCRRAKNLTVPCGITQRPRVSRFIWWSIVQG